jgi:iron complex outermembrane receptor protein
MCVTGDPSRASAQAPASPTRSLKSLSVDDLVNLEVTSVSRRGERIFDAAASIYVISAEDIRRSGVTTLPEALRLAPNLNVARLDPVEFAISARGFNNAVGNKLLVLIDGRTVYTPLFSGVFWDQQDIPLDDIERIEVISGPGATLWGANAVNGVINVITKPSTETQGGLLSTSVGSTDRDVVMRWGDTIKSASYRAYAKFSGWDRMNRANGTTGLNEWSRGQVGGRADWGGARSTLTVQGDAYTGASEDRGHLGTFAIPRIEVGGANVLTRWARQLAGDSSMQVQAYFDHATRDDFVLFRPEANLFDVEFQHSMPVQRHRVLWGGGYRRSQDEIGAAIASRFIPDSRALNWENVFVHGELRLTERVGATLGTKLENNDYTGLEHLPSVRLTWRALESYFLWSGYSRAVRAPARYDREVFFPMEPPFLVIGGPNFQSEVADVLEVGHRGQPTQTVGYSITGFAHVWDKLRSGTAVPVQMENKIEGTVYGVEMWGTYQPLPFWTWSAGASFLSERLRLEPGSGDPVGVNNPTLRNDPDYLWMLRSGLDLPANFEADVSVRAVAALPSPVVPAYTEMDVRLGWRPLQKIQLAINGRDLLHDTHPEFGDIATRSQIRRRVSCEMRWLF